MSAENEGGQFTKSAASRRRVTCKTFNFLKTPNDAGPRGRPAVRRALDRVFVEVPVESLQNRVKLPLEVVDLLR
jgi:hypothetical protein